MVIIAQVQINGKNMAILMFFFKVCKTKISPFKEKNPKIMLGHLYHIQL